VEGIKMARILILGADGMVGHIARIYLTKQGHDIVSVARSETADWSYLDLENETAVLGFIAKNKPQIVLNCVGILIKESEQDPERAIRLNALLPQTLSRMGSALGYRLIHVSSDCVFSGNDGPYSEGDRRDADEAYGRTKALGEIINDRDLTIRTSKVGPELKPGGSGLFNWFKSQHGSIKGFTKAMWGGVTTLEMAKAIDASITDGTVGLVHLTNGEPISKFDLLSLFKEIWCREDIIINRDDNRVSDRSLLCNRNDYRYPVPSYRDMLIEMKKFMIEHQVLYGFYEKNPSCN
jgi:dTDP-4-dehydrorhamnose reductase